MSCTTRSYSCIPQIPTWLLVLAVTSLSVTIGAAGAQAEEDSGWVRIKLDDAFRSEGVAAADVNHDGRMDVIAGDVWYAAPETAGGEWTMHEIRKPGEFVAGKGYSNSFANFAYDVNGDGWDDAIIIGFPGAPFSWYENPKNEPGHWKAHLIWHSACNESPEFEDVTGDGKPELILGSQPESLLGYLSLPPHDRATMKWEFHAVGEKGEPRKNGSHRYYHGLGVGDVNGDKRADIMIPHGWWEGPKSRSQSPWTFHPWTLSENGAGESHAAANMYVDDFDKDGDADIVMSSAHRYGLWWFEDRGADQAPRYRQHLIDDSYSQTHAIEHVDMNGDGQRDIVTGKRFYAHNGNDPGGKEPVVMYWYEVKPASGGPEFVAHEIVAGRDTGIGTQFLVTDVNGDKRPDIVLSNKKGVNVLLQKGGTAE